MTWKVTKLEEQRRVSRKEKIEIGGKFTFWPQFYKLIVDSALARGVERKRSVLPRLPSFVEPIDGHAIILQPGLPPFCSPRVNVA